MTNAIDDVAGIYQYQVAQISDGAIEVRIVLAASASETVIRADILRALAAILPKTVEIRVRFPEAIAPRGRHKVPLVVSEIGSTP